MFLSLELNVIALCLDSQSKVIQCTFTQTLNNVSLYFP